MEYTVLKGLYNPQLLSQTIIQTSKCIMSSRNNIRDEADRYIDDYIDAYLSRIEAPIEREMAEGSQRRRSGGGRGRVRRQVIERDRERGQKRLWQDYFADDCVYPANIFRRRFRMQKHLFMRIVNEISENHYFQQRPDATGRMGLTTLQKCTAAIRILAYGSAADAVDEYVRIGETTATECLKNFTQGIIDSFAEEYLRRPTPDDLRRLLYISDQRGFPGMLGSIDCMHWEWKNCPVAWKGQFQGRSGSASIVLEAVASQDLWIWHAFFGVPGVANDLNVLYRSPLFDEVLEGRAPNVNFSVNGNQYHLGYYLTDGIYPPWAAFIQSIPLPQTAKDKVFAEAQEAARKDVERAFGVLQARFAIIRNPSRTWDRGIVHNIMKACIILHNMIVEDERDTYGTTYDPSEFLADMGNTSTSDPSPFNVEANLDSRDRIINMNTFLRNREAVRNRHINTALKRDLIEHIWERTNNENV